MTQENKIAQSLGTLLIFVGSIFITVLILPIMGALAGWIVGLFFGDAILETLAAFGVKGVSMWKFGALLGFVGGFMKTKVSATKAA